MFIMYQNRPLLNAIISIKNIVILKSFLLCYTCRKGVVLCQKTNFAMKDYPLKLRRK